MSDQIQEIPTYSIGSLRPEVPDVEPKGFDIFRLEFLAGTMGHLRSPHRHQFYFFLLITEGSGSHDIDFTNYELRRNRLFMIAPGQIHSWQKSEQVKGFVVLFTDTFVALSKGRKLMAAWPLFRLHQGCYLDLSDAEASRWVEELQYMEAEVLAPDDFSRDAIFYSLGNLLVRASRLFRQLSSKKNIQGQDVLFVFQELIEKHYTEYRAPRDYASLLNITPNYLNALCKKKSGKSAGELIRQRVLLESKRLLAHTPLSVAEIAHKLNFDDNSYFGRYFKKYVGMTPETFRKSQNG